MTIKTCPNCGLYSVESALACDCGYNFVAPGQAAPAAEHVKKPIPRYPWLTIWYKPRGTIRAIVDNDPDYGFLPLVIIFGALFALNLASTNGLGDALSASTVLIASASLGPLLMFVVYYISGAIQSAVGGWLGGFAGPRPVRLVLAWSSIPGICYYLIALLFRAITYGPDFFLSQSPRVSALAEAHVLIVPALLLGAAGLFFLSLILNGWQLFIQIKGLSEVHAFSVWRAIATMVIPILISVGLALGLQLI